MDMSTEKCLEEMKNIETNILDYLDNEDDVEGKYKNLNKLFDEI